MWLASSVTPPTGVYSPAESVVGSATWIRSGPPAAPAIADSKSIVCASAPLGGELDRVDWAAAAEADHAVGAAALIFLDQRAHGSRRYVLAGALEYAGQPRAGGARHLVEQRRAAERLASHNQRALKPAPLELAAQTRDLARAKDDLFQPREVELARHWVHRALLRNAGGGRAAGCVAP